VGLSQDLVVAAARALVEANGLDKLSLRAVAAQLGVAVNTVAWHVGDKEGLLTALADAMIADCVPDELPELPEARVRALLDRLYLALSSQRDGGRLARKGFVGAKPHTSKFSEVLLGALRDSGRGPREAAWTAWTLIHFVLGLVDEEQESIGHHPPSELTVTGPPDHPFLRESLGYLTEQSFPERFAYGVDLILGSTGQPDPEPIPTSRPGSAG
jgi:TetR/AcrR family tetracycline transcriptional repressor